MPSDSRASDWHNALVRELLAVSPALVYDPVAGGDASAAPLLRELRGISRQIQRAQEQHEAQLRQQALQRRNPYGMAARPRTLPADTVALDPAALKARLHELAGAARTAIRNIERNRRFRDVPTALNAPTLYQAHDLPRSAILRQALRGAQHLARQLYQLPAHPAAHAKTRPAPHDFTRAELALSALYERWVFLHLLRAFQQRIPDTTGALAALHDLERAGTEGALFPLGGLTIRIRFEPWILSRETAVAGGHGLYRAGAVTHAWRPDIVIQVEDGMRAGIPVVLHACIIDAKLAANPRDEVWDRAIKYRHIRASINDRRVVRTIALALPTARPVAAPADRFDRLRVQTRALPLLPGDSTGTGQTALQQLVADLLDNI